MLAIKYSLRHSSFHVFISITSYYFLSLVQFERHMCKRNQSLQMFDGFLIFKINFHVCKCSIDFPLVPSISMSANATNFCKRNGRFHLCNLHRLTHRHCSLYWFPCLWCNQQKKLKVLSLQSVKEIEGLEWWLEWRSMEVVEV